MHLNYPEIKITYTHLSPKRTEEATSNGLTFHFIFAYSFTKNPGYVSNVKFRDVNSAIRGNMTYYLKAYSGHLIELVDGRVGEVSSYLAQKLPAIPSIKDVQSRLNEASKVINDLYDKVTQANKEVTTVHDLLNVLDHDIAVLEKEVQQPEADIRDLAKKYAGLNDAVKAAQKALNDIDVNGIGVYRGKIVQLESILESLNEQLAIFKANPPDADKVKELTAKAADIDKQIQDLMDKVQVLKGKAAKTQNLLNNLGTLIPGGIPHNQAEFAAFFKKYKIQIIAAIIAFLIFYGLTK